MASSIPEARARLELLADEIEANARFENAHYGTIAERIRDALTYMHRSAPARERSGRSPRMTEQLRSDIRSYSKSHPHLAQHEIAAMFDVNPGRVSETLRNHHA